MTPDQAKSQLDEARLERRALLHDLAVLRTTYMASACQFIEEGLLTYKEAAHHLGIQNWRHIKDAHELWKRSSGDTG